jgi:hypothetical protein
LSAAPFPEVLGLFAKHWKCWNERSSDLGRYSVSSPEHQHRLCQPALLQLVVSLSPALPDGACPFNETVSQLVSKLVGKGAPDATIALELILSFDGRCLRR